MVNQLEYVVNTLLRDRVERHFKEPKSPQEIPFFEQAIPLMARRLIWRLSVGGLRQGRGTIQLYNVNPMGTVDRINFNCKTAGLFFTRTMKQTIADCRNPRVQKLVFSTSNAVEESINIHLMNDLWSFADAVVTALLGRKPSPGELMAIASFLDRRTFNVLPHPAFKTTLKVDTMRPNMSAQELLRFFEVVV